MKCVRCNRPLDIPTAWVPTREGPAAYGPKCARIAGLMPEHPKIAAQLFSRSRPRKKTDDLQMELELTTI